MLTPRTTLARRVTAALDASPSRIPVLLGGCGSGRTTLLRQLRDRIGRTAVEVTSPGRTPGLSAARPWASARSQSLAPEPASNNVGSSGVVLLAVGLVGLFAGSTVMVVRRRRVPARTPQ